MLDAKTLIDSFKGQVQPPNPGPVQPEQAGSNISALFSGKAGLATGAVAGGLAGLLLGGKKPKKIAQSALKMGGMAVVGGIAYKAWNDWQAKKAPVAGSGAMIPDTDETAFLPEAPSDQHDLNQSLIRAMITAAKADGHITLSERQRIEGHLKTLALGSSDEAFIKGELSGPMDIGAVAESVKSPEHAAELYAASLLVVDPEGAAERGYLAMLAARLGLDGDLVAHLHARTDNLAPEAMT